jgi:hypothetical protein
VHSSSDMRVRVCCPDRIVTRRRIVGARSHRRRCTPRAQTHQYVQLRSPKLYASSTLRICLYVCAFLGVLRSAFRASSAFTPLRSATSAHSAVRAPTRTPRTSSEDRRSAHAGKAAHSCAHSLRTFLRTHCGPTLRRHRARLLLAHVTPIPGAKPSSKFAPAPSTVTGAPRLPIDLSNETRPLNFEQLKLAKDMRL